MYEAWKDVLTLSIPLLGMIGFIAAQWVIKRMDKEQGPWN